MNCELLLRISSNPLLVMSDGLIRALVVGLGGGLGAIVRYLLSGWSWGRFPLGTLVVNVVGCLLIGYLLHSRVIRESPYWQALLIPGFLGGLTTFSTFGYQSVSLSMDRQAGLGVLNVVANLVLGLAAVWVGLKLARG